jgi:Tol biopolymer transport system component
MKRLFIFLLVILTLVITSCGPSAEEVAIQTATASTAIAASWTKTPTPTLTHTPTFTATLTPTPTMTPTITPTPLGGGSGQIICEYCNGKPGISLINLDGTGAIHLTDKNISGVSFDWSSNGAKFGYSFNIGTEGEWKPITCVIDAHSYTEQCFEIEGDSLALSPDGSKIAIGRYSPTLYLVDLDSGKSEILMEREIGSGDWFVDWSPDGTQLAVAGGGNKITLINFKNDEKYVLVEGSKSDYFITPRWSPDGTKIVLCKA